MYSILVGSMLVVENFTNYVIFIEYIIVLVYIYTPCLCSSLGRVAFYVVKGLSCLEGTEVIFLTKNITISRSLFGTSAVYYLIE
jgi:hypothetical protein